MMSISIKLPCAHGSDSNCHGRILAEQYSDSYFTLTEEQQEKVDELAENYTKNGETLAEDIDGIYVEIEPAICSACGSDYCRDREGNIIMD